ncbi:glucosaminidase domain-containing protein [Mariprofundus sp. KV]|uniref:glucosaminidase domain-containing protein n=1 Tax=Mariprofundus sp. KV TaxID=2608715 RepID=UPI0015A2C0C8|nr:glucosaminidase domain-containing protein [Mariprofundus sp. KV]
MNSDHLTPKHSTRFNRILFTMLATVLLASCAKVEPKAVAEKPAGAVVQEVAAEKPAEPVVQEAVAEKPAEPAVQEVVQKKAPKVMSTAEKKRRFFAYMKPFVVEENNRLRELRGRLLEMRTSDALESSDLEWLTTVAARYNLELQGQPDQQFWDKLLRRVGVVPVEMALVQAANESAWGQSRFAKEGKNYFGQWCYSKGCGIVPSQRNAGSTHEVRRFSSPAESVQAYIRNINRSRAYREFRQIRSALRQQKQALDAEKLAMGLKSYSERGMAYVKTIQAMIRTNRKLIAGI